MHLRQTHTRSIFTGTVCPVNVRSTRTVSPLISLLDLNKALLLIYCCLGTQWDASITGFRPEETPPHPLTSAPFARLQFWLTRLLCVALASLDSAILVSLFLYFGIFSQIECTSAKFNGCNIPPVTDVFAWWFCFAFFSLLQSLPMYESLLAFRLSAHWWPRCPVVSSCWQCRHVVHHAWD